jgi:hypothetical protein
MTKPLPLHQKMFYITIIKLPVILKWDNLIKLMKFVTKLFQSFQKTISWISA